MGKTINSKWKKARRREKRIKYGEKELLRLKEIVDKREMREKIMKDIEAASSKLKEEVNGSTIPHEHGLKSKSIPKNLLNKAGRYSPWWNKKLYVVRKQKTNIKRKKPFRKQK